MTGFLAWQCPGFTYGYAVYCHTIYSVTEIENIGFWFFQGRYMISCTFSINIFNFIEMLSLSKKMILLVRLDLVYFSNLQDTNEYPDILLVLTPFSPFL